MAITDSEIELARLTQHTINPNNMTIAELEANLPRKSDEDLAREYAVMMEQTFLDIDDMDIEACPPDRRIFKGGREAWVYEHGNIAELVFVK